MHGKSIALYSRRDRAVLQLAYEHLRDSSSWGTSTPKRHDASNALHAATCAMASFSEKNYMGLRHYVFDESQRMLDAKNERESRHIVRVLRVRLVLFIRMMLRADLGDMGRLRCCECGGRVHMEYDGGLPGDDSPVTRLEVWCGQERKWRSAKEFPPTRRFISLWEQARQ